VLQISVPGKVALVSVRSLEVQEEAAGNVVVVCARAREENKQAGSNSTSRCLMINSYQAFCLGDRLVGVKGWFINNSFKFYNNSYRLRLCKGGRAVLKMMLHWFFHDDPIARGAITCRRTRLYHSFVDIARMSI
jgi:hypothetical protein